MNGVVQPYLARLLGDDLTPRAPRVLIPPRDQDVLEGESGPVAFSVGADGSELRYEWRRDGTPIPGAHGPSLLLRNVALDAAGHYAARVSNALGDVTSGEALLRVVRHGEALKVPEREFISLCGYDWFMEQINHPVSSPGWHLDTNTVHAVPYSLRCHVLPPYNEVGAYPSAAMTELKTRFPGPGRLSFWYKGPFPLEFYNYIPLGVSNPVVTHPPDTNGWTQVTADLKKAGPQEVRWVWRCLEPSWLADVTFVPDPIGFRFLPASLRPPPTAGCSLDWTNTGLPRDYRIEWSADLSTWLPLGTADASSLEGTFTDPVRRSRTFYRAVSP